MWFGLFFSFLGHLLFWPNFAFFGHVWLFWANLVVSGYIFCFGLCWMLIWAIYAVFGYFGCFWIFWPFWAILSCFGRFTLYLMFWSILAVFGHFPWLHTDVPHLSIWVPICRFGPYFGCKGSLFLSQTVPRSLFQKDLGPYFYAHRSLKF